MRFFLGTHKPSWLADARFASVPLFVSRRTLPKRALPRAVTDWALDSGGFTELTLHGRWTLAPRDYVAIVRRCRDEIGRFLWAAPQDWMCEPTVLAKTGLTVSEHQRRTVDNFLELRALAPDLPFVPVLQGWGVSDYWRCEDFYARAGVDLGREPLVGVGTVCRRQASLVGSSILATLASTGLRLHGFGFKVRGVAQSAAHLASADSLAWSLGARREPPMEGHAHGSCANCPEYALRWREDVIGGIPRTN